MFTESSEFYDLIYSFKDYRQEADLLRTLIHTEHPGGRTLLDIACGTGALHPFLQDAFSIDGLDINTTFLDAARIKNPDGKYYSGNMADFNLEDQYDVITCLFSSIGYLKTRQELNAALRCFAQHLRVAGLVIVEPWLAPEAYHPGKVHMTTYDRENIKICRMNRSSVSDDLSVLHFHYLLGTPDDGVIHFEELHELRMSTVEEMKDAFRAAGLKVRYDSEGLTGRGLYIGRKTN